MGREPVDGAGLIDLGEDRSQPVADRYRRPTRRPTRRPSRRLPPVLAAVLAAVAIVVAAGPERVRPGLVPLAEVPATRSAVIALSPDTAFVGDSADATIDGRRLPGLVSAYPLPGGAPRWRSRVPVPAQELWVAPGAGVVLATAVVDDVRTVAALDAGTGRVLWQADSRGPVHVPADGAAALFYGPGTSVGWVDLRSGRDVWTRSVPQYGDFGVVPGAQPGDRARVVTVSPEGEVEVVDESTGAPVTSGRIEPSDGGTAGIGGVSGRILATRRQPSGTLSVTAFDPDTFRPLWTIAGTFQGVALPCGHLICMPDADGLNAVDPASGATVWRNDDWDVARPLAPGRLLAVADDLGRGPAVLGAATGQVLTRLTGWTSVDDLASRLPVLLARPDDTGGSIIAEMDQGLTQPAVLGDLRDAAPSTCQAASGVLVCATVRHTLRMWRYRR
jgi:outer membrane protein assembly factor BamB